MMPKEIPEARKIILRSMAKDCDLSKLKSEIVLRKQNKKLFQTAIEQEDVAIAEYEYMILVQEARVGG